MKELIQKIKKERNKRLLEKCIDLVERLESCEVESLMYVCEVELEERNSRKGNTIECLNVPNNY